MKWPFATEPRVIIEVAAQRGIHIVVTVLVALLVRWLLRRAITGAMERLAVAAENDLPRAARLRTLGGLLCGATGNVIVALVLLMVLAEFGLDTKAILTAAGIFGVAIGFGSQKLVRDVIGGFFILFENQFSVGETVTLGGPGATGVVEEMGLRVTRLRDDIGRLVIVGNADITSVTNHSRGPLTVTVDVLVPEDTDAVAKQADMARALERAKWDDWEQAPRVLGLVEPPAGMLKIRVSGRALPGRHLEAERELRAALYAESAG